MRLHRFITEIDLDQRNITITDSELVSQWRTVLRLKPGDSLILSDGHGREATATIVDMDKKEARLEVEEPMTPEREPKKEATLYAALLKRENFELVVQKATEIGIVRIVPLLTERTVKTGFNRERLEKIVREASEQSGRTTIPKIAEPMAFAEAVTSVYASDSILFDLTGTEVGTELLFTNAFIGPEGGFSEAEVIFARDSGLTLGLMGNLTMRGETAAIIAAYLISR
jgi:16S rRNA (uracil1498-N3)-methyltransferase